MQNRPYQVLKCSSRVARDWRPFAKRDFLLNAASNHVDVLIVGAGLSGVGAAHTLQERCPTKSFLLLEARHAIGGTWDLFRYPGVRSDSDMSTFGYRFQPWTDEKVMADGPSILKYIRETAADAGIDKKIRFGHRMSRAEWSSAEERWTVWAERDGSTARSSSRPASSSCAAGTTSTTEATRHPFSALTTSPGGCAADVWRASPLSLLLHAHGEESRGCVGDMSGAPRRWSTRSTGRRTSTTRGRRSS